MRSRFRVWILLFCGIPIILMIFGFSMVWNQHQKLRTYQPVAAIIMGTDVKKHVSHDKDGTSVTYEPIITYRYEAANQSHQSSDVFPLSLSQSRGWAQRVVANYRSGSHATAYVNPADPSKAFLIPHRAYFPYIFTQFPMLFLLVGFQILSYRSPGSNDRRPPQQRATGEFVLRPVKSIRGRAVGALVLTIAWLGVGGASAGHYFLFADQPYEMLAFIAAPIYAGVGFVPVGMLIYNVLVLRDLDEPTVMTDTDRFLLGQPFTLLFEQRVRTAMKITSVKAKLVCQRTMRTRSGKKTTYATDACYETSQTLVDNQSLEPGQPISAMTQFTPPAEQSATSPRKPIVYPYYDWELRIHVEMPGRPDYHGTFAITVESLS
ncbi:MAG: DUF3592 domain-containing protein [Phycisphaeraceae bacterium]|nr:DUF3592 domain-containing protein [Phycisphaeraceae bacterium]